MSLTSYRAAPPRDKPLRAPLKKPNAETDLANAQSAPIDPVRRLPERATPGKCPWGRGAYVRTPIRFGKGCEATFDDFVTPTTCKFPATTAALGPSSPYLKKS